MTSQPDSSLLRFSGSEKKLKLMAQELDFLQDLPLWRHSHLNIPWSCDATTHVSVALHPALLYVASPFSPYLSLGAAARNVAPRDATGNARGLYYAQRRVYDASLALKRCATHLSTKRAREWKSTGLTIGGIKVT